jgi:transcriptional regulator with XRE-family HTH domain
VPGPNPTLRQRELGTRLRELRAECGLTVEQVAAQLLCSATKISRIETGGRRVSLRDVRDLCQLYRIDEQAADELMDLARQAREPGWWTPYPDLRLSAYIGLEHEAVNITVFSMYTVPALLQTTNYAEALITGGIPGRTPPSIVQQRLEALLRRQDLLSQPSPPRYRALLDEAVLHRLIGNQAIMAEQLGKILALAHAGQATVQVIPFIAGAHGGKDSNFELFEFGETSLQPVVFIEGQANSIYHERPTEISAYREALDRLRDAALSPRESLELVSKITNAFEQVNE